MLFNSLIFLFSFKTYYLIHCFGCNLFNLFWIYIIDYVWLELYTNNFGGYKVEEKLYLGVREQNRLNATGLDSDRVVE
jgi:hypothetical protein